MVFIGSSIICYKLSLLYSKAHLFALFCFTEGIFCIISVFNMAFLWSFPLFPYVTFVGL